MELSRMLDLNIEHLRDSSIPKLEELARLESKRESVPIRVLSHAYGFIVYCSEIDSIDEGEIPAELVEIINKAYKANCILINFDSDAEYHDQFMVFNG